MWPQEASFGFAGILTRVTPWPPLAVRSRSARRWLCRSLAVGLRVRSRLACLSRAALWARFARSSVAGQWRFAASLRTAHPNLPNPFDLRPYSRFRDAGRVLHLVLDLFRCCACRNPKARLRSRICESQMTSREGCAVMSRSCERYPARAVGTREPLPSSFLPFSCCFVVSRGKAGVSW